MDELQNPPAQFQLVTRNFVNPVWLRWFQKLKSRIDEVRRKPYATYTSDQELSSWEIGKTVLFEIGAADAIASLPAVVQKDVWSWITIVRIGTGMLYVKSSGETKIERKGSQIVCDDNRRIACNVTLQLVKPTQWAIVGATGIWKVSPY